MGLRLLPKMERRHHLYFEGNGSEYYPYRPIGAIPKSPEETILTMLRVYGKSKNYFFIEVNGVLAKVYLDAAHLEDSVHIVGTDYPKTPEFKEDFRRQIISAVSKYLSTSQDNH